MNRGRSSIARKLSTSSRASLALPFSGSRDYDPEKGKAKEAREDVDNFLAIDKRPRFIGRERVVKDEV